jgi:hypothetical protein
LSGDLNECIARENALTSEAPTTTTEDPGSTTTLLTTTAAPVTTTDTPTTTGVAIAKVNLILQKLNDSHLTFK